MSNPNALVIHPVFSTKASYSGTSRSGVSNSGISTYDSRDAQQKFDEICGLARAINLNIVHAEIVTMREIRASTSLSASVIERLAEQIEAQEIELLVLNQTISATQHRNLEEALNCKILDRTTLILEIFGARAQSREARWQVTLAAEEWQRSRLVKSWTHLERQRGGAGFMGGPGERQLELDRRMLDERIVQLKKRIKRVARMRDQQRRNRKYASLPIIALTGYTNSGKSTLFEHFCKLENLSQDMLFATLETKTRNVRLPSGQKAILSDTVGFVSELPHMLIDAFRSTLEEVREADILLHVRDVQASDFQQQSDDVLQVLKHIFNDEDLPPILEVWNKADLLSANVRQHMQMQAEAQNAVLISAHNDSDCALLAKKIDAMLDEQGAHYHLLLRPNEAKIKSWLYQHGHVLTESWRDDGALEVQVVLSKANYGRLQKQFVS
ncbi:MAG: GTPase HflX [Alphaproteobacteria bacterium]|nr:GTPase HflX [Alphaproteobacteria bacterium]